MPSKTNQAPKGWKAKAVPSPKRSRLPLYLAGGALLVIIIGIVLLTNQGRGSSGPSSPAPVAGQPKLLLDREQIDFGKVPLDLPVKAAFKLTNVGDQPLQILNQPVVEVKQGC
jgi:hypothetical protein